MVCICSLRTQQRAKSQCIVLFAQTSSMRGWFAVFRGLVSHTMAMIAPGFPGCSLCRQSAGLGLRLFIGIQRRV